MTDKQPATGEYGIVWPATPREIQAAGGVVYQESKKDPAWEPWTEEEQAAYEEFQRLNEEMNDALRQRIEIERLAYGTWEQRMNPDASPRRDWGGRQGASARRVSSLRRGAHTL